MPLIKIIATGGTIANTGHGLIAFDEVLKDIPQARAMANFEITEATRVRSGSIHLAHWLDIARAAADAAEDSRVDAIIVTHGTFTTEETAYFLHLTVSARKNLWSLSHPSVSTMKLATRGPQFPRCDPARALSRCAGQRRFGHAA